MIRRHANRHRVRLEERSYHACSHQECALMLDMRVIFTGFPAGLRGLPSVETEDPAWLLLSIHV